MPKLLCFGLGFSARTLARTLMRSGWEVVGTTRAEASRRALADAGFRAITFTGTEAGAEVGEALEDATHLLVSVVPADAGDPCLSLHGPDLRRAEKLEWIGYLSTIGVYGDHGGAWIDEATEPQPVSRRGKNRLRSERQWLNFGRDNRICTSIFRLGGIYGPGRSPFEKLRSGKARRIIKPGQVFNRVHVEDIARALAASIAHPVPGAIYNVVDDEPAPPQDVIEYAARLIGCALPPEVPFAAADLSPAGRGFYSANRRVRNDRLRALIGGSLTYPNFRVALSALARAEGESAGPEMT